MRRKWCIRLPLSTLSQCGGFDSEKTVGMQAESVRFSTLNLDYRFWPV